MHAITYEALKPHIGDIFCLTDPAGTKMEVSLSELSPNRCAPELFEGFSAVFDCPQPFQLSDGQGELHISHHELGSAPFFMVQIGKQQLQWLVSRTREASET
ncbi:hypothetical protein [Ferrimonas sp. YFM]|uniref:DUF6916 family protein n=1 Tax=Ferrimonas sp. YFM TaxID=3028878 RepID=UPI002573A733|nr:hypothetical protein [Ferrimonas sp. YFM]BDY06002.1 hypothetical protein F0521_30430 [Ferrimonas sp. YFM]